MPSPLDTSVAGFWTFPVKDTGNGRLTQFQEGEGEGYLPFAIGKVLVVDGMEKAHVRGAHSHWETAEIVVALRGGCSMEVDDGKEKKTFRIDDPQKALFLPPKLWRTFTDFDDDTLILIVADRKYDEKDYIRDYEGFLQSIA